VAVVALSWARTVPEFRPGRKQPAGGDIDLDGRLVYKVRLIFPRDLASFSLGQAHRTPVALRPMMRHDGSPMLKSGIDEGCA
jgi:hypothetical protein